MKEQRILEIERYLNENEMVSIDTLCSYFQVSKNTIRRDIAVLDSKGVIKKVYGGIALNNNGKENTVPFYLREIKNQRSKSYIGKLASQFINDGDVIFIDSGTTTIQLMPFIGDKNITLVTNNLNAIIEALNYPNINTITTGGKLYLKTNSFIGEQTIKNLKQLNISKAFLATTGISIEKGCTNSSSFENEVKKTVFHQSDKIFVLADHTKYDVISLLTYCKLEDIYAFITDEQPPQKYMSFFKNNRVKVIE